MRVLIAVAIFCVVCGVLPSVLGLPNLIRSELYDCMVCLCHAVSGCYRRENCARYSISESYWRIAGSPDGNYQQCMRNENCILNAIKGYTDSFDNQDCNCDGQYDCRDMLALHLSGAQCRPSVPSTNLWRYNNCARDKRLPQFPSTSLTECPSPPPE